MSAREYSSFRVLPPVASSIFFDSSSRSRLETRVVNYQRSRIFFRESGRFFGTSDDLPVSRVDFQTRLELQIDNEAIPFTFPRPDPAKHSRQIPAGIDRSFTLAVRFARLLTRFAPPSYSTARDRDESRDRCFEPGNFFIACHRHATREDRRISNRGASVSPMAERYRAGRFSISLSLSKRRAKIGWRLLTCITWN